MTTERVAGTEKIRLSFSALAEYYKCPYRYYLTRVKRWPDVASAPCLSGSAAHIAMAHNLSQKLVSGRDAREADVVEVAVNAFRNAANESGVRLIGDERQRGLNAVMRMTETSLISAVWFAQRSVMPRIVPAEVEQWYEFETSEVIVRARIDTVTDDRIVRDWKFSKRPMSDTEWQGVFYAEVYRAKRGVRPRGMNICQVKVKSYEDADDVSYKETPVRLNRETRTHLRHRIRAMIDSIRAGAFIPAHPDSWWCGPLCPHYERCKYTKPDRRATYHSKGGGG